MYVSPFIIYLGLLAVAELVREQWMKENPIQHREKWTAFGIFMGLFCLLDYLFH